MANCFLLFVLIIRLWTYPIFVKGTKLPIVVLTKPSDVVPAASAPALNDIYYLHQPIESDNRIVRSKRQTFRNDKGFIRLGKNVENPDNIFERQVKAAERGFIRFGKSEPPRNNGFIRFGRGNKDGFVRFGRNDGSDAMRFGRRGDKFIRFGKRTPSDDDEANGASKASSDNLTVNDNEFIVRLVKPISRYGRLDKFIRFGRRDQGFIRFGKRSNNINNTDSDSEETTNNDGYVTSQNILDDIDAIEPSMLDLYLRAQQNDDKRQEIADGKLLDDSSARNILL